MHNTTAAGITGQRRVLVIGMWSAWLYFALSIAYAAAAVAAGVVRGRPKDTYWAIAEIITVVGTLILVTLVATIHESAPPPSKVFTLMALGWTLIMAALTITVHFVELTFARRIDVQAKHRGTHACSPSNGRRCSWRSNSSPGTCSSA